MTNSSRRSFFTTLGKLVAGAVVAPTVLPAATTYARRWIKGRGGLYQPNPAYVSAKYESAFCWTEADLNKYHKLPFYLAKAQIRLPDYKLFEKLGAAEIKWKPSMGDTMRGVIA